MSGPLDGVNGSSSWAGSARCPTAPCCWPRRAPRSCGSPGRDAPSGLGTAGSELLLRSRTSIGVDLKSEGGVGLVLDLVERADALVEGFRPGVAERMGLGPDECLARTRASSTGG